MGYSTNDMNCVNAYKFEGDDLQQYAMLPSYSEALEVNEHKAIIETANNISVRMVVVYREGIQAFQHYASHWM
ncbi:hypothetical protein Plhal304r1_c010g0038061 [Plasmopara halstedii]